MDILLAALLGYALGSIPFGLLLAMTAGVGDIRKIGSGNIGATNVLRTGNKGLAAATLLLDLLKGFLAVFIAWQIFGADAIYGADYGVSAAGSAAVGAVIGHCFPLWLKLKGGKGVATLAGVCFGLAWPIGLFYALAWIGMLAIWRISSLAGMTAAAAAPLAAYLTGWPEFVPYLIGIAVLILFLHRANIGRLIAGAEPKVGSK